jgi:hypothetical protein
MLTSVQQTYQDEPEENDHDEKARKRNRQDQEHA